MHTVEMFRTELTGVEVFRLTSVRSFPRHSHDQFGIGLIESGSHRSWSDFGSVDGNAGDVIMVNPGEMHDGEPLNGQCRSWRMVYLDPRVVYQLFDGERDVTPAALLPRVADQHQAHCFSALFQALTEMPISPEAQEECLLRTVVNAFELHSTHRTSQPLVAPSIIKAKRQMDAAPELSHPLHELAKSANTSRFRFLRAFRAATGATPHAYLMQRRVLRARQLITACMDDLTAVSLEAGFADQSHMTRAFVNQLGITPARYRSVVCAGRTRAISFKTRRD